MTVVGPTAAGLSGRIAADIRREPAFQDEALEPAPRPSDKKSPAMKRMLIIAALGLAGLGLGSGQANAWIFSHFCRSCHKCCDGTICLKQYNAFSPVASGSLVVDGCLPIFANTNGPWPSYGGMGCGPMGCGADGGYLGGAPLAAGQTLPDGAVPPGTTVPGATTPTSEPPVFNAPTPTPAPAAGPAARMARPPIQMAGYRPPYFPGYGYPGYGYPGYGYPGYGYGAPTPNYGMPPGYGYPGYGYPGYGYPGYGYPGPGGYGPMAPMMGGQ